MPRLLHHAITLALCSAFLTGCGKKDEKPKLAKQQPAAIEDKDPSSAVETFTGAHTRVVWAQYQKKKTADPYASNDNHFLMGLDTRDGKGVRAIRGVEANYTRPILSADGATILYTAKNLTRDAQNTKRYAPVIMRTDWSGAEPARLADGYAVDAWADPATRIEWIYAARDFASSTLIAMEARRLVRFQLNDPAKEELVWDQTAVSPDSIQLSRHGSRACGQFPWPDAGQLVLGAKPDLKKLANGCWTSIAPDDSRVSWVLTGDHRHVTLFADDGARSWPLALNSHPELEKGEIYHPRWSNHPRFITLTGPYIGEYSAESGSAIGKGGLGAEVWIGKLGDQLDKVESWLRVTNNPRGDGYPDVWIEGGEKENLPALPASTPPKTTAASWPVNPDGLVFFWTDSSASNSLKLPDGRRLDCSLMPRGAARFGRHHEMLLDAGVKLSASHSGKITDDLIAFQPKPEAAAALFAALSKHDEATVECVLIPSSRDMSGQAFALRIEDAILSIDDVTLDCFVLGNGFHRAAITAPATHVALVKSAGKTRLLINGVASPDAKPGFDPPGWPQGYFTTAHLGGGTWNGGLLNIAAYSRALSDEEIATHTALVRERFAKDTPPQRVKLRGRLVESAPLPTPDDIAPYNSAMIECVYEVTRVIEGDFTGQRVLVAQWAVLDRKSVEGFPRERAQEYELLLEPYSAHPQLTSNRSMTLPIFDLDRWYEVSKPSVR